MYLLGIFILLFFLLAQYLHSEWYRYKGRRGNLKSFVVRSFFFAAVLYITYNFLLNKLYPITPVDFKFAPLSTHGTRIWFAPHYSLHEIIMCNPIFLEVLFCYSPLLPLKKLLFTYSKYNMTYIILQCYLIFQNYTREWFHVRRL